MDYDHRETAANWHGGRRSPMYAYASTGSFVTGLADEIRSCLLRAEPEDERKALKAFLKVAERNEGRDS